MKNLLDEVDELFDLILRSLIALLLEILLSLPKINLESFVVESERSRVVEESDTFLSTLNI